MWDKFAFAGLCCLFSTWAHADWTISQPSPISNTYSFTYASVFCSCDPTTGQYLATWVNDNNQSYPTYSFFTPGTGWSAINPITTSSQALLQNNVITSCNPVSGQFLATWTDMTTAYPTSSLYTPGTGWSPIDALTTVAAASNTANSFDSTTGQFLTTWADPNNNNYPTYAFYDPHTGWNPPATISTHSRAANVYTSFDPTTDRFLAVWVDIGTGRPMYAFYTSGTWSPAASIAISASVDNDVLCTCDPATGIFIATWADINQNLYPFYSVYTPGSGWSASDTITTASGVTDNVTISYDLNTGQYLAAWSDYPTGIPTYSFYTPSSGWSPPAAISASAITGGDVITCFNSPIGQFLATWADSSNSDAIFNPTYAFFTPLIQPPASFTGSVLRNRFLTETDIIHRLAWTPPADASSIVSYQISRNGIAIALVPASGPFVYYDHNQSPNRIDVYTIVSVNTNGETSVPLSVTL